MTNEYANNGATTAPPDQFKQALLIMLGLMVSVLTYCGMAFWLTDKMPAVFDGSLSAVASARWVYGFALLSALAVILLRRALFQPERLCRAAGRGGAQALVAYLISRTIILAVVCELIAIAGFVLALLVRNPEPAWRLGIVSLALMAYIFPRRSAWQRTIENFSQAVQDTP